MTDINDSPYEFKRCDNQIIACVGNNSGIGAFGRDHLLADGYTEAVDVLYKSVEIGDGTCDLLVYPIIFNARQSIELMYKLNIRLLKEVYILKNKRTNDKFLDTIQNILIKHDIEMLNNFLINETCCVDFRIVEIINEIKDILRYAEDYYLDNKADTFRYTFKRDGKNINLDNIEQISLTLICERHKKLKLVLDYFFDKICEIYNEYTTNTFVGQLSRKQIGDIAEKLPPYSEWKNIRFKEIKNNLKKEYTLSSKELSETISIIKGHMLFCTKIGLEKIYKKFSENAFEIYGSIVAIINKEINNTNQNDKIVFKDARCDDGYSQVSIYIEKLTYEDKVLFMTFFELGMYDYRYCESIDAVYKHFNENVNISDEYFYSKLLQASKGGFKKGLDLCGQKTYIEKFNL